MSQTNPESLEQQGVAHARDLCDQSLATMFGLLKAAHRDPIVMEPADIILRQVPELRAMAERFAGEGEHEHAFNAFTSIARLIDEVSRHTRGYLIAARQKGSA